MQVFVIFPPVPGSKCCERERRIDRQTASANTHTMIGVLNLDKPPGLSSAAAVGRVKRLLPRGTRIGHAGTLDPFATGVLLLLIGRATKSCESLMDQPKQYETTIKFGATTATDDPESPEQQWTDSIADATSAKPVPIEQIRAVLPNYVGQIQQRPPTFSAMKIGGRRAYVLARQGKPVAIAARTVNIYSIELLDYQWPLLQLKIDCGRGTYIRSIARDLGAELNVGGYLTKLRRTRIGPFTAETALPLASLTSDQIVSHLSPVESIKPASAS